jgi:ubiquinone/menaquinone biosynthesis C-methylase UbiE
MVWDQALDEIRRVLKDDGVFILVDLFDASFTPLYAPRYAAAWTAARILYLRNGEYYKKLRALTQSSEWRRMVREHPKRSLSEAKEAITRKFRVKGFRILSAGFRGLTAGFVCGR